MHRLLPLLVVLPTLAIADDAAPKNPLPPLAADITPPKALKSHTCAFPMTQPGSAEFVFAIATDGSVKDLRIYRASGDRTTVQLVQNCVAKFRYAPATKDGQPIEVPWWVAVSARFD